jgi:hypothetical protein
VLRRLAERASADAANGECEPAEREDDADDAAHGDRERHERDASSNGNSASRATRAFDLTTDCDDVEPLPLA